MSDHPKENEIPLTLGVIGLGLCVLGGFIHHGSNGASSAMIAAPILASIETIILIGAAIVVATVLHISFGDLKSATTKFGGIALFAAGVNTIFPWAGVIGLVIFLGLVMWLFEIELVYAIVLAIVNWIVTIVVVLAIGAAFL